MKRPAIIPPADRIGLSRTEAADYVGVSPSYFDGLVRDGLMPPAKCVGSGRFGWDRRKLEKAYADLPDADVTGRTSKPEGSSIYDYDPRYADTAL